MWGWGEHFDWGKLIEMERRQFTLKIMLWVMVVLYLIVLVLPIRLIHLGEQKIFVSGFQFMIPLGCLVFIIPILLLVYFSKQKVAQVWSIVLSSLHLLFCLFTCIMAMESFHKKAEPMESCWLFIIIGVGFLVICIRLAKNPIKRRNDSRVLDQLP